MSVLEGTGHSRDRQVRAVLGVVVAACVVVFAWFVSLGRLDFFSRGVYADLFDIQARSMLDGRLHAADDAYGIESFVIDGRTYTYFGAFPSLLRMPVFVLTDSYDGRLTTVSMLLGYILAMVSVAAIIVRARRLARPEAPWTPQAVALAAALLAVVGLGSNIFILASAARVYYEAIMWGAAGALASFAAILGFLLDPTRRRPIVLAGLGAAAAWLSRGSVGLAPSIALGLLSLTYLSGWRPLHVLAPRPDSERRDPGLGLALLAAAALPALAFAAINTAKFGSPTALPGDKMSSAGSWEHRVEVLDRYGHDMSSPVVVPAHLVQDFRPDLVSFDRVWPFVHLNERTPPGIGNVFFDTVEPTAGVTVTAPALLVLAVIGSVAVVRRRRDDGGSPGLACLRPFLLGGLAPMMIVASIAFVAQRYLTDMVPLLVVGAVAGLVTFEAAVEGRVAWRRWAPLASLGVVMVAGLYITASVTWELQRFVTPPDAAALAAGLRTQAKMADLVGVRDPGFTQADALPSDAVPGELAIVGDCDGLYEARESGWFVLEAGPARGHHVLELVLDGPAPSRPAVLLASGSASDYVVIGIEAAGDDQVRLVADRSGAVSEGRPFDLTTGEAHRIDVWVDPEHLILIQVDGIDRHNLYPVPPPKLGKTRIGENPYGGPIDRELPGTVRAVDVALPTCEALAD